MFRNREFGTKICEKIGPKGRGRMCLMIAETTSQGRRNVVRAQSNYELNPMSTAFRRGDHVMTGPDDAPV